MPKQIIVDLGFRGVDQDNPGVEIIHRGKYKSLTKQQRAWLKRRQAVEPAIGHLKQDHRMDRCWLKGSTGDAIYTVLCAVGYNLRWLMRAIMRYGIESLFLRLRIGWCGTAIPARTSLRALLDLDVWPRNLVQSPRLRGCAVPACVG